MFSRDASFVSERVTLLKMAQRQVRDGAQRIVRQKAIIDVLDRDILFRPQAAMAREILTNLHTSFDALNSRLRAIEDQPKS